MKNEDNLIVVVDDDPEVRCFVQDYLEGQGFRVAVAADGREMRALLDRERPDLVLLDLNLPGEDGFTLARSVRSAGPTGIIMLTALGDTRFRVQGLRDGADDYVTKPFEPRELLARIRAVLRRMEVATPAAPVAEASRKGVAVGRCRLDLDARKLTGPDGEPLPLTAMEFELLRTFLENPNRVLSRGQLLRLAHNRDGEASERSVDIRINRLRQKLEPDPTQPSVIETVRGEGYRFVPLAK